MKTKSFTTFVLAGYVLRAHHEGVDVRALKRAQVITLQRFSCNGIPGILEDVFVEVSS